MPQDTISQELDPSANNSGSDGITGAGVCCKASCCKANLFRRYRGTETGQQEDDQKNRTSEYSL